MVEKERYVMEPAKNSRNSMFFIPVSKNVTAMTALTVHY